MADGKPEVHFISGLSQLVYVIELKFQGTYQVIRYIQLNGTK